MPLLTRDQILECDDIQVTEVDIPEWGGSVLVRSLTAAQVERAQARIKGKGIKGATSILVALACIDEDGKRVFQESDLEKLSRKSFSAQNRILTTIMDQNAMDKAGIEELAKNSENGQGESLLSD